MYHGLWAYSLISIGCEVLTYKSRLLTLLSHDLALNSNLILP